MAIAMFAIVIAIPICRVPLVVASVELRATAVVRSIIGITVAAPNSGSVTVLETGGRAIAAAETPGAAIATALNAAGRTIAAAAPVAASAAVTATTAAAAVTATAATTQRASATAGTTAATGAGATAAATPASAATSAAAAVVGDEIDKVGAGVGRGLDVQHWRRIGDSRAQHDGPGESRHRFPIDTHCDLHRIWSTRQHCPAKGEHCFTHERVTCYRGARSSGAKMSRETAKNRARTGGVLA
jgi:hypothetical protein